MERSLTKRQKTVWLLSAMTLIATPLFSVSAQTSVSERQAQLEAQLKAIEEEISQQQVILQEKQRESVSLERDVAILDAQIEKTKLSLQASNLAIRSLEGDISGKENTIRDLDGHLDKQKAALAELIRRTGEMDDYSLVEVALSKEALSDFFIDLDSFSSIQQTLQEVAVEIVETKNTTETQKQALEEKKQEEVNIRQLQQLEQQRLQAAESKKNSLLKETKGQEAVYATMIKQRQQTAAEIRTALFQLQGSAAIPFEKALDYATRAGAKTGVRPALILGIVAEESNLGENVGTGTWTVDMHPTRDVPVFKEITARLGLDPDAMPVSKKPWYGWGGAMGPAQFIPSTWVLYEDRIAALSGNNPPNPWNPEDAFMAAAILLADNGATDHAYASERLAALRYFAGWANAKKAAYAFYGDDVMDLATKYQSQINILNG